MPLQHTNIMDVVVAVFSLLLWHVSGQPQENASEILLRFKTALANSDPALANWNPSTPPCTGNTGNWVGVHCFNGYVWGLQLDNMGLQGQIDVDSLAQLPYLRSLSFVNNSFQGSMPDWRKISQLKSLYLNGNQFSGQIANDAFAGMTSLNKVYLSNNKFTGPIPDSLASPNMVEVGLDSNSFSGAIPAVNSPSLKVFNVSNNQLQGPIPPSLQRMDPSSFSGNKALCGSPGGLSCDPPKPPPDMEPNLHSPPNTPPANATVPKKNSRKSSPAKIGILIFGVLLGLFIIFLLLLLCWRIQLEDSESPREVSKLETASPFSERKSPLTGMTTSLHVGEIGGKGSSTGMPWKEKTHLPMAAAMTASPQAGSEPPKQQQQASQLSFVKDYRQKFDLPDLMRASAEALGTGNFGVSYKAVLVDGEAVVVKRFKQMNTITKEEFHEHMKRLGRLKHPNLLPLVAYLYRKEEKLLVFDFVSNSSLAKHLYAELRSLTVPHAHLKSSNVLIDDNYNARLMDYTLGPVVNPTQISQALVAYKCPEYGQTGDVSKKSDVWCLGILILETLTGKPVADYLGQGSKKYGDELARWVNGIVQEASTNIAQVLDKEMEISTPRSRLEIEKLLQIGIACSLEDHLGYSCSLIGHLSSIFLPITCFIAHCRAQHFRMIEALGIKRHPFTLEVDEASGNKNEM